MNRLEAVHQKDDRRSGFSAKAREVHRRGGHEGDNEYMARMIVRCEGAENWMVWMKGDDWSPLRETAGLSRKLESIVHIYISTIFRLYNFNFVNYV